MTSYGVTMPQWVKQIVSTNNVIAVNNSSIDSEKHLLSAMEH